MKIIKIIIIFLLSFIIVYSITELFSYLANAYLEIDLKNTLVRYDKKLHFGAGSIAFIFGFVLFSAYLGLIFATLAGILKEVYDYYNLEHTACIWDIFYTILGALATLVLLNIIL